MSFLTTLKHNILAARARAYVRVIGANREPSWIITEVTLPVLSMAAYIFIYRALGQFSGDPLAFKEYEALVVAGGAIIPYWMVVLWSMAAQFFWEKQVGNLDLYLASHMHPVSLLLGMAGGGMFMASVRTVLILLVGIFVFNVEFYVTNWPLMLLIFMLTLTALFSMGMAAASVFFLVGRAGIKINMIMVEPIWLLSGIYFPVRNLGFVLGLVASILPLTLGLDGIRQLILPSGKQFGFLSVETELAILFVMTIIFTIMSFWLIARMEEKGKENGLISLKWQ